MKKMDLLADEGQFKIGDTNTLLHFTATLNNAPVSFTDGDLTFQIKNDHQYIESAKGTAQGSQVVLNSKDISNLAVGKYQLELWHQNADGTTDIYPSFGFLPFQINENAVGGIGKSVVENTMNQMQDRIQQLVENEIAKQMANFRQPIDGTNGHDGQTPTIQIGQTIETDPGTKAKVEDIGGSLNHIFNFYIPKASVDVKTVNTTSLTNCKTTGLYMGNGTGSDAPTQNRYSLIVNADSDGASQMIFDLTTGNTWSRTYDGSAWTAWRQITQWN